MFIILLHWITFVFFLVAMSLTVTSRKYTIKMVYYPRGFIYDVTCYTLAIVCPFNDSQFPNWMLQCALSIAIRFDFRICTATSNIFLSHSVSFTCSSHQMKKVWLRRNAPNMCSIIFFASFLLMDFRSLYYRSHSENFAVEVSNSFFLMLWNYPLICI